MNHYDRLVTCFGHTEATNLAVAIAVDALATAFVELGIPGNSVLGEEVNERALDELRERVAEADDHGDELADERIPFTVTELGRAVTISDLEEVG